MEEAQLAGVKFNFNEYQMYQIFNAMQHNAFKFNDNKIDIKLFDLHCFDWKQMHAIIHGQKLGIDWHEYCNADYSAEKMMIIILNKQIEEREEDTVGMDDKYILGVINHYFEIQKNDMDKNIDARVEWMNRSIKENRFAKGD
jgi:hypothetical protein